MKVSAVILEINPIKQTEIKHNYLKHTNHKPKLIVKGQWKVFIRYLN